MLRIVGAILLASFGEAQSGHLLFRKPALSRTQIVFTAVRQGNDPQLEKAIHPPAVLKHPTYPDYRKK
jgi:hypothetical protein